MRRPGLLVLVAVLLVAAGCGGGSEAAAPTLAGSGAWARPTPGGADKGVVYLTVTSDRADAVVGASVPGSISAEAQLHQTMGAGGGGHHHGGGGSGGGAEMASMAPVRRLPVGPEAPLVFEPGGNHVMLVGLARPLVAGDRFTLSLRLRSGRTVRVPVRVQVNPPA